MTIAEGLLPEFDHEMKVTRTLLERVPLDSRDWKPHDRSRALGTLAAHIALLAGYGTRFAKTDVDIAPPPGTPPKPPTVFATADALLSTFDANVVASRDAIAGMSDDEMGEMWTMRNGSHVIVNMPRGAALRAMLLSHMIHHRGQLSVYLRLNNVPLPSIYGPTADTERPA